MDPGRLKYYILLHVTVFIFGFTGILGKLIELDSFNIVFYRTLIAFLGLILYMRFKKIRFKSSPKDRLMIAGVGVFIAAHWITFFSAIHISNVSIALACFSSAALFTSILEPIILKKRFDLWELMMGLATIAGISIITSAEFDHWKGILLSVISAFLGALFGVLNAKISERNAASEISTIEMLTGCLGTGLFILITDHTLVMPQNIQMIDWLWLVLLGLVATSFAFVATVYIMRVLTPFTVAITINLEPVYAIIMALILFPETEKMSPGFYEGAGIIIVTILINAYLKKRKRKRIELGQLG